MRGRGGSADAHPGLSPSARSAAVPEMRRAGAAAATTRCTRRADAELRGTAVRVGRRARIADIADIAIADSKAFSKTYPGTCYERLEIEQVTIDLFRLFSIRSIHDIQLARSPAGTVHQRSH